MKQGLRLRGRVGNATIRVNSVRGKRPGCASEKPTRLLLEGLGWSLLRITAAPARFPAPAMACCRGALRGALCRVLRCTGGCSRHGLARDGDRGQALCACRGAAALARV